MKRVSLITVVGLLGVGAACSSTSTPPRDAAVKDKPSGSLDLAIRDGDSKDTGAIRDLGLDRSIKDGPSKDAGVKKDAGADKSVAKDQGPSKDVGQSKDIGASKDVTSKKDASTPDKSTSDKSVADLLSGDAACALRPEVCDGLDNNCDGLLGYFEADPDNNKKYTCQGDCGGVVGTSAKAATFDGNGDVITVANQASYQFGKGSFTIDFFINPKTFAGASDPADGIRVLEASAAGCGYPSNPYWVVDITAQGSPQLEIQGRDANNQIVSFGSTATGKLALNSWSHVTIRVDRAAGETSYYINGAPAGVAKLPAAALNADVTNTCPLVIGANWNSFNGQLDELRLWNLAMPMEKIWARVCMQLTGAEGGLVLYYPFESDLANHGPTTIASTVGGNTALVAR